MITSNKPLRTPLSALAATAVLLLAGPVHAGLWGSDYDPPAFIGSAVFDVPTPCLSGVPDGEYAPGAFAGCSPIRVVSNIATTPAINFSSILPSSAIFSYDVIGGQFVGVDTGSIGFATVGTDRYWFEFVSNFIPGVGGEFPSPPSVTNVVNLYRNCSTVEGLACGDPVNVATTVTFAAVPEPASLGLMLGAFGAGWLARRRKVAA
jgi:hypothetical protein